MPELTVVLPVRDGSAYLRRAVTSTLRALPRDAQIAVVDDASTDATPQIVARLAERDPRVLVLRREESTGISGALNDALARTDSRFVARMDADDVCLPTRFTRQRRSAEHVDYVFGSSVLIDGRGRVRGGSSPLPIRPAAAALHLLVGNYFSHPTMFGSRAALDAIGGYRDTRVEDFDVWLRAAAAGQRLQQSPLPAIAYRRHGAQTTTGWVLTEHEPRLDEAYRRLLPDELLDVAGVLRLSAVTRDRSAPAQRAAWERLAAWLRTRAEALPALDRAVLLRRIAAQRVGAS